MMNMTAEKIAVEFDMFAEAERLFSGLEATSTSTVGITREAYGKGEQKAVELFITYAKEYSLETSFDGAGNLVIVLPGANRNAPCIACGSHLDSVPQGGNFDGAAGIVAGVISLARMQHESFVPDCDLKVMAFRCEESAWYGKPYIGSSHCLANSVTEDLEARHRDGK